MNIVDFLMRRVLGQLVNRGIKAGVERASGTGKARAPVPEGGAEAQAKRTPEERQAARQAREAKQIARRARQAAKLSRKLMR